MLTEQYVIYHLEMKTALGLGMNPVVLLIFLGDFTNSCCEEVVGRLLSRRFMTGDRYQVAGQPQFFYKS